MLPRFIFYNLYIRLYFINYTHGCTNSVMSKMATGYEPDGSLAPLYDLGWVGPAGQMFSTTADLNTVRTLI